MVLGAYWYYAFPTGLYDYTYFEFQKGLGGHANNPAELVACIKTPNPTHLRHELQRLVEAHIDAFLFVQHKGELLQIGTGGYQLHDFEFELCLKIEQLLHENRASKCSKADFTGSNRVRMTNPNAVTTSNSSRKHFSIVATGRGEFNAETYALRLDCHLKHHHKAAFLDDLAANSGKWNIDVIEYLEQSTPEYVNLMLFLTNGRQGVRLKPKQHVDIAPIEKGMEELLEKYDIQIGHIGGMEGYPKGNRKVLKGIPFG